jgi:ribonuclease BN (tRNA processing enzyme)
MKVKILGTGTCVPSLHRGSSSYLVQAKQLNILIDVGPSVVRRLLEYGVTTRDIDIIILTHFHVDHTADLSTFLFVSNYDVEARTKMLSVVAGKGLNDFYKGLIAVYPWITPKSYDISLNEISEGTMKVGGLSITTAPMVHNNESIGMRIEENKSVTFSGDTDYTETLVVLARATDLFVVECSFPEKKVNGHLDLATLQNVVGKAKPKRVILSHLYPDWDDFRGILHSPYLLGEDGMEIEV